MHADEKMSWLYRCVSDKDLVYLENRPGLNKTACNVGLNKLHATWGTHI